MFDNKLSFFENKGRRTEYDKKIKKLKDHFIPKNVLYKLEVSPPQKSCYRKPCPLELRPTKLSDSSLEYYRQKEASKSKRKCKKSKTKHNIENSNQQSYDDSILTGLQTVIDLCGLLEECDKESKLKLEKTKNMNKNLNEKPKQKLLEVGDNLNSSSSSHESHDPQKTTKSPNGPSGFRKFLIRASRSCIINKSPFKSPSILSIQEQNITPNQPSRSILSIQERNITPNQPSSQSVGSLDTLNTHETVYSETQSMEQSREYVQVYASSCCKSPKKGKPMKPIEEEPQVCSNTASIPGISCAEYEIPCGGRTAFCKKRQSLRRRSVDDDIHRYWAKRNRTAQTEYTSSRENIRKPSKVSKRSSLESITHERPSKPESSTGLVKEHRPYETPGTSTRTRQTCLSSKCFPPLEIVPDNVQFTSRRPLSQRTFTCEDKYVVHPEYSHYDENPSVSTRHTAIYTPSILCNKDFPAPMVKSQVDIKKGRPGVPLVQPVLGFCTSARCGTDHLKSIKYALVKISEFVSFSTYEIMKPYKDKPKHIPTCIAEIFVTSPLKKREEKYIVTRAVSLQTPLSKDHPPNCVTKPSIISNITTVDKCACREDHDAVDGQSPTELPESQMHNEALVKIDSGQPEIQRSVVLREFDTYKEPSPTEKPFQLHSKEGSKTTFKESSLVISTPPTESTQFKRTALRTTDSNRVDSRTTHFKEPTITTSSTI